MAERSIAVRLRAEVTDFNRQISSAATSLDQVVKKAGQGEKAADTFMGRVAQSAQLQREAWTTVGTTVATAGAAVTGLGAAALATGISYNTLRQQSVAALTSLTGSTEDALAQMDRLDAFASNSPFARDVFIRAQQQMMGFGIETQKVLPYLDSIQNAVAAAGGSNHDIAELSRIFSQISASAKITATDLREFGNRGVDAATLIGSQMGMTGAQIREAITEGSLDANEALDALSAGMSERFAGAADGVKNTFVGALDRVKAAWRDASSAMAEPLVGREGGGLGVEALNALADAMRSFESLPDPVIQAAGAVGMLTGAAALGAGGLIVAVPRYMDFRRSLAELADISPRAARGISRVTGAAGRMATAGAVIGVTAVAVGNLVSALQSDTAFRSAESIAIALERMAAAGEDFSDVHLDAIIGSLPTTFGMAAIEAQSLGDVVDQIVDPSVTDRMADFFGGLIGIVAPGLETYTDRYREVASAIDEALVAMVEAGDVERVEAIFANSGRSAEDLAAAFPLVKIALEDVGIASEGAAEGIAGVGEASEEAEAQWEAFAKALTEGSMSFVDTLGAWDAVIDKNRELAEAEADRANEGKKSNDEHLKSWEDFYDGATVSIGDYLDELEQQVAAQRDWEANMTILAGRVSEGTLQELARLGEEGAPLVAALVDATPEEMARFEEYMAAGSSTAASEFAVGLIEAIPLIRGAMTSMGDEAIAEMADRLRSGETTLQEEIDSWMFGPPAPIPLDMETGPALWEAEQLPGQIEDTWRAPVIPIEADPASAESDLVNLGQMIDGATHSVTIEADDTEGMTTLNVFENAIGATSGLVSVGADTDDGYTEVGGLMLWTGRQTEDVTVGAETSTGQTDVDSFINRNSGREITLVTKVLSGRIPKDGRAYGGPIEGYAFGGAVYGPGTGTSDSILATAGATRRPIHLSNGEHVWTAAEVEAVGGHGAMYAIRSWAKSGALRGALGFRDGGEIAPWRKHQPAVQYQPTMVAAPAPVGLAPIHVTLHGVPMDVAGETAKAVGHTVRHVVRTSGFAGGGDL